jgi:multidrug transporter EmrE-like cation transporter
LGKSSVSDMCLTRSTQRADIRRSAPGVECAGERPLTVYGLLALVILGGCFWALSQVLTRIPMGVAYAIWSGAGIALICVAGWLFFRQPLTTMQVLCIGLVVVGAIGLSLSTNPA